MRLGAPFNSLNEACAAAVHRDLSDIIFFKHCNNPTDMVGRKRRPILGYDTEVILFPQTWSNTACGYDDVGVAGQAFTSAYTIIVATDNEICVYFGCEKLAYKIDKSKQTPEGIKNWEKDLANRCLVSTSKAGKYN